MENIKLAVFGEILWDIFGDEKTIGGAPFNFAAHSAKLGADVDIISAVGKDALGDAAIEAARGFGVSVGNVARVDAPTGYCRVTLNDGVPSYELVRGVAYDMISPPAVQPQADAFYFGTLAARSEVSAETLAALTRGDYREIFFDINIRQSFYTPELIDASLRRATIFKLSREEMGVLEAVSESRPVARADKAVSEPRPVTRADKAASEPRPVTRADARSPLEICSSVAERYPNLRLVILTLDRDGALVYETATGTVHRSPCPTSPAVSTVGAGDSFSACFLVNYLRGLGIDESLRRATLLSDYVVTQLGAVPDYPERLAGEII